MCFRAGDITELKILEIPGPGDNQQVGDLHQTELGPSGVGYQMSISQNGTGKVVKKPASSSSAPQSIPKRTDVKSQDVAISPQQQQCSKSYVDRHMESLSQSKSFRRRHNSCKYSQVAVFHNLVFQAVNTYLLSLCPGVLHYSCNGGTCRVPRRHSCSCPSRASSSRTKAKEVSC